MLMHQKRQNEIFFLEIQTRNFSTLFALFFHEHITQKPFHPTKIFFK